MTKIDYVISCGLMLVAAMFAIRGWLVNQPNLMVRCRDRFYASAVASVAMVLPLVDEVNRHHRSWVLVALYFLASWNFIRSAQRWYRLWDGCRQQGRRVDESRARRRQ